MIKPGSRDIKVNMFIAGEELEELQKHTWSMAEAFGLDRRIEQYKRKRPIVSPRCGERTMDEVFLTELGQSQMTEATMNL